MLKGGRSRYVVIFGVVILIIIGVYAFATRGTGQTSPPPSSSPSPSPSPTPSITSDSTVQFTVQGPVVANELYRSATITVNAAARTLTLYATYTNQITESHNYANNQTAYTQFSQALNTANFTQTNQKSYHSSPGGNCPTGLRYTYNIFVNSQPTLQSWATSCQTQNQTATGNYFLTNQLFRAQIPDLDQITDYQQFIQ